MELLFFKEYKIGLLYSNTNFQQILRLIMNSSSFMYQKNNMKHNFDVLNMNALNETFLNQTKIKISQSAMADIKSYNPNFDNHFKTFLLFDSFNLTITSSWILKPFKKPLKLEFYKKNSIIAKNICLGKLDLDSMQWDCSDYLVKSENFYTYFNIWNDGIYAIMINPLGSSSPVAESCNNFACKYPLAIAGIALLGILFILIILIFLRVIKKSIKTLIRK